MWCVSFCGAKLWRAKAVRMSAVLDTRGLAREFDEKKSLPERGRKMQTTKCAVLVGGKECGLALTIADRAVESGTVVYECPVGHRTFLPLERAQATACAVLANGRACGLALSLVDRDRETGTATYECALGHRSYIPLPPEPPDIC